MAGQTKKQDSAARVIPFFRRAVDDVTDEVAVAMPPQGVTASRVGKDGVDIQGKPPLWFWIGAGGSGKTMLARWMGWRAADGDRGMFLAAMDAQNRTLASFFDEVAQPPSSSPVQSARFLRDLTGWAMQERLPGGIDMGGGDTTLPALVEAVPDVVGAMEGAGLAPVAAYLLGQRVDDLASLIALEGMGFRPAATVLILNEGCVDSTQDTGEAFAPILAQPIVKSVLARGAALVWMPRLNPPELARDIERKRLTFGMARDGLVPDGRTFSPIGGLDRAAVRGWLDRMEAAFKPVAGWLP